MPHGPRSKRNWSGRSWWRSGTILILIHRSLTTTGQVLSTLTGCMIQLRDFRQLTVTGMRVCAGYTGGPKEGEIWHLHHQKQSGKCSDSKSIYEHSYYLMILWIDWHFMTVCHIKMVQEVVTGAWTSMKMKKITMSYNQQWQSWYEFESPFIIAFEVGSYTHFCHYRKRST